jgi:acetyltransferase
MTRGHVGPTVRIRRIRGTDTNALERFYTELSVDSRVTRFLGVTPPLDHDHTQAFCTTDHKHREGFVAVVRDGDGSERVVGHLCLEPDDADSAEIAVAVADEFQGRGIGRGLVQAAVAWARRTGLRRLDATAFATNSRIIRLLRGLGLPVRLDWRGGSTCEMSIEVGAHSAAA